MEKIVVFTGIIKNRNFRAKKETIVFLPVLSPPFSSPSPRFPKFLLYENRADSQYFRRTSGDLVDENEEDDHGEFHEDVADRVQQPVGPRRP